MVKDVEVVAAAKERIDCLVAVKEVKNCEQELIWVFGVALGVTKFDRRIAMI